MGESISSQNTRYNFHIFKFLVAASSNGKIPQYHVPLGSSLYERSGITDKKVKSGYNVGSPILEVDSDESNNPGLSYFNVIREARSANRDQLISQGKSGAKKA